MRLVNIDTLLELSETIQTDDFSGNELLDVITIEDIEDVEPVQAVPIDELVKLRDKIQKLHDDTDAKAKAQELSKGFNEKADLACFLYRNDFIKPLNELIERYSLKEKEEEMER